LNVPILGYGSESAEWLYNSATMTLEVWIAVMLSGIAILVTLLGLVLAVFAIGVDSLPIGDISALRKKRAK